MSEGCVVLLDRDGTLIEDRHYLHDPAGVVLLPGVGEGLKSLAEAGCRLGVLTNQSGIGRGYYAEADMHAVNRRMEELLAAFGVRLEGIWFCPHAPEEQCRCRKPNPGMALDAARSMGADLSNAVVVGDKPCDVELAHNVGAKGVLVRTGREEAVDTAGAEHVAESFADAVRWILAQVSRGGGRQPMNEAALKADVFLENVSEHTQCLTALPDLAPRVAEAAGLIARALAAGGKILFCGNGGSAADAQHLAAELTGRYGFDRRPLAAVALHCDTSALTAISNDYGYGHVFERQVQALGNAGDVLVGISTSGNSGNVLAAMQAAKDQGLSCIALTGQGGGKMAALADVLLNVPSSHTPRIQEMHILVGHALCGMVEQALCGNPR